MIADEYDGVKPDKVSHSWMNLTKILSLLGQWFLIMTMKVLYFLKINKKDSKQDNLGLAVWQVLLLIVFSGIIAYLILFIEQSQMTPVDCSEKDNNKDRWVKCKEENIDQKKH